MLLLCKLYPIITKKYTFYIFLQFRDFVMIAKLISQFLFQNNYLILIEKASIYLKNRSLFSFRLKAQTFALFCCRF